MSEVPHCSIIYSPYTVMYDRCTLKAATFSLLTGIEMKGEHAVGPTTYAGHTVFPQHLLDVNSSMLYTNEMMVQCRWVFEKVFCTRNPVACMERACIIPSIGVTCELDLYCRRNVDTMNARYQVIHTSRGRWTCGKLYFLERRVLAYCHQMPTAGSNVKKALAQKPRVVRTALETGATE